MAKDLNKILKTTEQIDKEIEDTIVRQREYIEKLVESHIQTIQKWEHHQVKSNYVVLGCFLFLLICSSGIFLFKYINVISQNFTVPILVFICNWLVFV